LAGRLGPRINAQRAAAKGAFISFPYASVQEHA
jgi:hypothetical protein